jgi:hypothetical protein
MGIGAYTTTIRRRSGWRSDDPGCRASRRCRPAFGLPATVLRSVPRTRDVRHRCRSSGVEAFPFTGGSSEEPPLAPAVRPQRTRRPGPSSLGGRPSCCPVLRTRGRLDVAARGPGQQIASTANGSPERGQDIGFGLGVLLRRRGLLYGSGSRTNPDTFRSSSRSYPGRNQIGGAGQLYGMLFGAIFVSSSRSAGARPARADLPRSPHQPPRSWSGLVYGAVLGSVSTSRPQDRRASSPGRVSHPSFTAEPRIVEPHRAPPQATPKGRRRGERRLCRCRSARRCRRRWMVRPSATPGVTANDPARGHVPPQRAGLGYAPIRRDGRSSYVNAKHGLFGRQIIFKYGTTAQPGQHRQPAHKFVERDHAFAGRRARPAPDGGAQYLNSERFPDIRLDGCHHVRPRLREVPVDDRLAARLRRRRRDLRQVRRPEPAEREDRHHLPERQLRRQLPERLQGRSRVAYVADRLGAGIRRDLAVAVAADARSRSRVPTHSSSSSPRLRRSSRT